ncbi:U32 family peptidase [Desulfobacterales bacterium HSG17]|nr:U32 family peptidase [Desulfobacterales bacterium HSG17]
MDQNIPEILAPAGNRASFMAALAAGADAIYCSPKSFSARMEAQNFELDDLSCLTTLAHGKNKKVYIALNSLIKPGELKSVTDLCNTLSSDVNPDGFIVQDPGLLEILSVVGYTGEIHLSTLANVSFGKALSLFKNDPRICRVVVPRELSIDEIKAMADHCPPHVNLEVFVHGALCFGVSGRCYWSSFLGGKSGLRGRCVQPCRRVYQYEKDKGSYFSCADLSLDVLVKPLLSIPQIAAWKIEGRRKSPHYVYYVVSAYRILRDLSDAPEDQRSKLKKDALSLLESALSRPTSHYRFLPQRPYTPTSKGLQQGSGQLIGVTKGGFPKLYINPNQPLFAEDLIRIGTEDSGFHQTIKLRKAVPKRGNFHLKLDKRPFESRLPVYLIDRREPALARMIAELSDQTPKNQPLKWRPYRKPILPPFQKQSAKQSSQEMVYRQLPAKTRKGKYSVWLSLNPKEKMLSRAPAQCRIWLPPVIWPDQENGFYDQIQSLLNGGVRSFVLNALWQITLFNPDQLQKLELWAGPFCNISNPAAIVYARKIGFSGVIVSPELSEKDYRALASESPLPLGIVLSGFWPICISRIQPEDIAPEKPIISPKKEETWSRSFDETLYIYPNWRLDLSTHRKTLSAMGFKFFFQFADAIPKNVTMKERPGYWNFTIGLR